MAYGRECSLSGEFKMKPSDFMKNLKKRKYITIICAIAAFAVSITLGYFYYDPADYPIGFFRWLMILHNSILAFAFKPEIKIADVAEWIQTNQGVLQLVVSYAYVIALFVAPYCTIMFAYKLLERFIRWDGFGKWKNRNKTKCFILGYNDEVKAILKDFDNTTYFIHVVSDDIDEDTKMELLKQKVVVDAESSFDMNLIAEEKAKYVLLFDKSAAKNFSRYQMFFNEEICAKLEKDIKFYCRCEDFGIQGIIETYQDYHKDTFDLELVNPAEIQIRELIQKRPLHSYHNPDNAKTNILETKTWNLHLLIVGFGKLGQQMLLQAMNMGVVNSENEIIIDVVDYNIEEKRYIFENYFGERYVTKTENEVCISPENADGVFRVRFHKVDVRFQSFSKVLDENGNYTYIAVCLSDMDIALHCLSQIRFYLHKRQNEKFVPIALKIAHDHKMKKYLRANRIDVMEEVESILTLEKLLHKEINRTAKRFDQIYRGLNISEKNKEQEEFVISVEKEDENALINAWNKLDVFKRKSNYAIAYHQSIKEMYFDNIDMEKYIGEQGTVLQYEEGKWNCSLLEDVTDHFEENKEIEADIYEFVKMEHRRWCYFVASCGLDYAPKKDLSIKEHDCLLNWKDLVEKKPSVCAYDLMPLLYEYKRLKDD